MGATGISPDTLSRYLSNIDGVDSHVIVDSEGFPLYFDGIGKNDAEEQAALAVDLALAISEHIHGKPPSGLTIDLEDGTAMSLAKVRDMLVLMHGLRKPVNAAMEALRRKLESPLLCPYCKADLTLHVYKCPSCGRSIPYVSTSCPHCRADLRFKKCPHCGNLLSMDGRRAVMTKDPEARKIALIEGGVGGVILGLIATLANGLWPAGIAAAIAGAAGIGWLVYTFFPTRIIASTGERR